jgi:ferredoxin
MLARSLLANGRAFRGAPFVRSLAHRSSPLFHGHVDPNAERITIKWVDSKTSQVLEREAAVGSTLLEAAHQTGIDLEGACEGSVACSTCHVVLDHEVFDSLPEASEDEDDMLDCAFGLTETSRLGCQVVVTPDMNGTTVELPAATRNFYVDGHVPKPH